MIKPDVNILVYAYDDTSPFYKSASVWLEYTLSEEEVFFSWQTICGFLRIVTNSKIYKHPIKLSDAIMVVESWLELENAHLISLKKENWSLFKQILIDGQAKGDLIMDAHIAAMAASCGATVASTDRDFTRFQNIKISDPLKKI